MQVYRDFITKIPKYPESETDNMWEEYYSVLKAFWYLIGTISLIHTKDGTSERIVIIMTL